MEEVCGKDNINIRSIEKDANVMITIKLQVRSTLLHKLFFLAFGQRY